MFPLLAAIRRWLAVLLLLSLQHHLIGPVQERQVLSRYAEYTAALVQITYRLTASSARLITQLFTRLLTCIFTCIFTWFELAIGIPS